MSAKFYLCKHCGNLIGMVQASGVIPVCCGEEMQALEANTVEASREKHLPVVEAESTEYGTVLHVKVGSAPHPMIDAHYIPWIFVETEKGGQRRALRPGDAPEASFVVPAGDKAIAVYAYCNLHGLWKAEVQSHSKSLKCVVQTQALLSVF